MKSCFNIILFKSQIEHKIIVIHIHRMIYCGDLFDKHLYVPKFKSYFRPFCFLSEIKKSLYLKAA